MSPVRVTTATLSPTCVLLASQVVRSRFSPPTPSYRPCRGLADIYDPLSMPPDLLKAHKTLDKAVLSACGVPAGATDTEILAELFKRYETLTKVDQLPLPAKKTTRKRAAKKT